jgi:hypothetical protein
MVTFRKRLAIAVVSYFLFTVNHATNKTTFLRITIEGT